MLGAAIAVWNVVTITLRQRLIPQELFGRVNGAFRWLGAAAGAVSVALGGVLAHATTVRMPYFVGGALTLVTAVLFARPALAGLDDGACDRSAGDRGAAGAHAGAAVDDERLAGDPRRRVGRQEDGEVGDVLRLAEALASAGRGSSCSPKLSTSSFEKSVFTSPGAMPTTRVGPISPASWRVRWIIAALVRL